METNKLDREIKERLESRKIEPSANAWDKLAENLDDQKQSSHKKYWLMGIAASFLAGIVISSFFFNNSPLDNNTNNTIVTQPENKIEEVEEKANPSTSEKEVFQEKDTQLAEVEEKQTIEKKVPNQKPKSQPTVQKKETLIAENTEKTSVNKKQSVPTENLKEEITGNKNASEISQQSMLASNEEDLSNEVDQLLNDAKDKVKIRNFQNPYNRVSANRLLENIEVEDKQNFKERILWALETGFQEVKSSVVK